MTKLYHISDLHFGMEDRIALDWFQAEVRADRPDAVIVTGDLTMRARSHEFAAAAAWLEALAVPVTVEVGNHDLPYFNPLARFATPYKRYRRLERMIERPLDLGGVTLVPLKTTARAQWRLNWSKGKVSSRSLAAALDLTRAAPADHVVLIACHHPLIEAGTRSSARTHGGPAALEQLAAAGAHAVLTGHVHDPFDVAQDVAGRTVRLIGAGTLSERVRDTAPSYNVLRIAQGAIELELRALNAAPQPAPQLRTE